MTSTLGDAGADRPIRGVEAETIMMDTKELLKRISALRQRLDQTRESAGSATATLLQHEVPANDPVQALQHKVETGAWETILLNDSMRQLPETSPAAGDQEGLPALLTSRGIRLLKRGRDFLHEMRDLAEDPAMPAADDQEPFCLLHREMVAVTDVVVRTVQVFPSAPSPDAAVRGAREHSGHGRRKTERPPGADWPCAARN